MARSFHYAINGGDGHKSSAPEDVAVKPLIRDEIYHSTTKAVQLSIAEQRISQLEPRSFLSDH
jgi:hypothetical protein